MTYSVFDLTEHTQMSIRGKTGSHPESEIVFGVFTDSLEVDPMAPSRPGLSDIWAYDDVDWERAVQMAKWILEWDEAFKRKVEE